MPIASHTPLFDRDPYIIAEIGVNHDGSIERAIQLIDIAADADADAVKFQYFEAERLMSRDARLAEYQSEAGESDPVDMLARLELTLDELSHAVLHAHHRGLHAIVTVFSLELCKPASQLPWDAFKIASPDVVNLPLIRCITEIQKPVIISTGAAHEDEVRRTASQGLGSAFLHCVSAYPTPLEGAQLCGIAALDRLVQTCHPAVAHVADIPVGYSDHTSDVLTGALAVAAGACILEKHITDDCERSGPDHRASLPPAGLRAYVEEARRAHAAMGEHEVLVQDIEADVRHVSRQSVAAAESIAGGAIISRDVLTLKRPGTGIPARFLGDVVGRRARHDIVESALIQPEDLEDSADLASATADGVGVSHAADIST